jgi:hypothetical protein
MEMPPTIQLKLFPAVFLVQLVKIVWKLGLSQVI